MILTLVSFILRFELNLMSNVSLEEAILLLRSNCFDKGGVAVGEMSPLSETWAKDLVNIEPLKMSDNEFLRAPASCTGACLVCICFCLYFVFVLYFNFYLLPVLVLDWAR